MQKHTLQVSFLVVVFLVFASAVALAQDTATLSGTIRDNTGAVIPGAIVSVISWPTGSMPPCVSASRSHRPSLPGGCSRPGG